MQEKLNDLNYESKKIGLHINLAKTEDMRINNKSNNTSTGERNNNESG
jgi:hypothetical protein